jgi:hypothetical protein
MWIAVGIIVTVYLVLYAVHYAYETVWNFVVVSPAEIHREQTRVIDELKAKVEELSKSAQRDVVRLSVSIRTEKTIKVIPMRLSESGGQSVIAHVSNLTLLVYNHRQEPVVLRACKLWKLHATEGPLEVPIHEVVTSDAPKSADIVEPLLQTLFPRQNLNFSSLAGRCQIRLVLAYSEGGAPKDDSPRDFEIICKQIGGATVLITAAEITGAQS